MPKQTAEAELGRTTFSEAERGLAVSTRDEFVSALFTQHYDRLRRVAFVMLGEGDLAEEIVMDAYTKVLGSWRVMRSLDGPPAYLTRMVINSCRTRLRRRAVESRALRRLSTEPTSTRAADASVEALDIWRAVRELPETPRACIVLHYLEDLTVADIAWHLDMPIGTVKSHLSRARAKLTHSLGADPTQELRS